MKLTHPDSEQTIEPKADHADVFVSQGWVAADEPATDKPAK